MVAAAAHSKLVEVLPCLAMGCMEEVQEALGAAAEVLSTQDVEAHQEACYGVQEEVVPGVPGVLGVAVPAGDPVGNGEEAFGAASVAAGALEDLVEAFDACSSLACGEEAFVDLGEDPYAEEVRAWEVDLLVRRAHDAVVHDDGLDHQGVPCLDGPCLYCLAVCYCHPASVAWFENQSWQTPVIKR